MPVYAYKGLDARGKAVAGVQDAESSKALQSTLKGKGVFLTEVREQAEAAAGSAGGGLLRQEVQILQRPIGTGDLATMTQQLATLIAAAVPLVESLAALIDQTEHPRLKVILAQVREAVNEGSSLADALERHGSIKSYIIPPLYLGPFFFVAFFFRRQKNVFPPFYINMVRSGEASGTLDVVLERLADFTDRQAKLKTKVMGTMLYPIILMCLLLGVLAVLMTVVVPKIMRIFDDLEAAIPWYTQLLITLSNFMADWWFALLAFIIGVAALFNYWKRSESGRPRWDWFRLRVPVFGPINRMFAVARFSRTLGTLLQSGVPILAAMDIVRNVLDNVVLQKVIDGARDQVKEGASLAKPLKESGQFPPMVTHMIAVGERTGELEKMLDHVAGSYETRVEARLGAITTALEPILIVLMAGGVAFVIFSILIPILKINDFAQ